MIFLLPLLAGRHFGQQHADRAIQGKCKNGPGVLSLGRISVNRNRELNGFQIRGRQFATLAHDVVADLLPLIEVAHAGAFDRGNVDKYIFPTTFRLYEAKALLGIEKLDCTRSHIWPPLKNADRRLRAARHRPA
jgi:hypothetical protein